MNWKLRILAAISSVTNPVKIPDDADINELRRKSEKEAALATKLFDKKVSVNTVLDLKAGDVRMRLYRHSDQHQQPVIIFFHGGGFVLRSIGTHDNVCRRLCTMNNCLVLSVDYRMGPEHRFPAAVEDAHAALLWVGKHVEEYGGDATKIIVCGDSAGGNLAAGLAISFRDGVAGMLIKAQVLIYPWMDGTLSNKSVEKYGSGYLLTRSKLFWFRKNYMADETGLDNAQAWPVNATVLHNLPPALIITAAFDPLLDDGKKYAGKLLQAGNEVVYKEYRGLTHGFFNMPFVANEAMQGYTDVQSFLLKVLAD